jgi:hypothetical protein
MPGPFVSFPVPIQLPGHINKCPSNSLLLVRAMPDIDGLRVPAWAVLTHFTDLPFD